MTRSGAYDQTDLFGSMDYGMQAKLRLMRQYPDIGVFAVRAFYEKDPEVSSDIQKSMGQYLDIHAAKKLQNLDPEDFIPGIDLQMMYREMYWASEGCLWEYIQRGCMNVDAMEKDYPQGWLLIGILFVPMFVAGLVMMKKNPELLKKRLNVKEEESEQRSVISYMVILLYIPIIVKRIRNEEQILKNGLPGYVEYMAKVKYRLIPFLW